MKNILKGSQAASSKNAVGHANMRRGNAITRTVSFSAQVLRLMKEGNVQKIKGIIGMDPRFIPGIVLIMKELVMLQLI